MDCRSVKLLLSLASTVILGFRSCRGFWPMFSYSPTHVHVWEMRPLDSPRIQQRTRPPTVPPLLRSCYCGHVILLPRKRAYRSTAQHRTSYLVLQFWLWALMTQFISLFSSVPPGKLRDSASTWPRMFPSKYFPVHRPFYHFTLYRLYAGSTAK
jgi:hypothetical protein